MLLAVVDKRHCHSLDGKATLFLSSLEIETNCICMRGAQQSLAD